MSWRPWVANAVCLQVATAWFDWLWAPAELKFDLSDVPPLVSSEIFPDDYREEMTWGTYRPGIYFGVKGRHPASLLFGLAWASVDGKILRHECESGELQAFSWKEHDGRNYGYQSIEDQKLGHELLTTFVKEDARKWHARIEVRPLGVKSKPISLMPYLGIEADSTLRVEGQGQEGQGPGAWLGSAGDWRRSLKILGEDPIVGPFSALLSFRSSAVSKPHFHHVSALVQHEADAPSTGVWDAKRHLKAFLRRPPATDGKKAKHVVLPDSDAAGSNFMAAQLLGNASLQVDLHVSFGRPIADVDAESKMLEDAVARRSQEFKRQLSDAFELSKLTALTDGNLSIQPQKDALAMAVSSLLGGLGSFRGKLLVKDSNGELSRLPEKVLFSAVPSRSFFPRGFLWDEGFHGLLLCRWQPRIFLDVLAHWLELQQSSGWIPREVPLGAEQEVRVPSQFLPQEPGIANPPSLLLPLAYLLRASTDPKLAEARALGERAGLSADEFRKMMKSFGAAALPRLVAWYGFLDRSQKSSNPKKCYRWFGRTAAHCLASGLDDYPRGLYVNDDECHLDLHSWMLLFARTLATLCNQLNFDGDVSVSYTVSTYCTKPDWSNRAKKLNETLFNVFASDKVLADYIGRQPVSSKGHVQVLPPWRSDGRCGPQFPVGKAPGECDPYGGAPCCSPSGWCGGSPDFCDCPGCRRFLKLEERKNAGSTALVHSPHLGYVSLFPLVLGHLPCDHPYAERLLRALQPGPKSKAGELWSAYGVLSLSSKDKLYRSGEDYWRGKIWGNLNYLTISALQRCASQSGKFKDLADTAFKSLKSGFVKAVLGTLERQRFFMENFDPNTGEGHGAAPFTGWTTLVALIMADMPLELDFVLASESRTDL